MTDSPAADPPDVREGVIELQIVAAGSKAESVQVVLVTDEPGDAPPLVLRSRGATTLVTDEQLAGYVARRVRIVGRQGFATFLVDQVVPLDEVTSGGCN